MRKHQYFKVPQLQRYNLDHSRLGGSGDHSETGEETECSCRPGHNRSLQVSCRGLNKGQSMYQSLLVVMLPGEAKKKKTLLNFLYHTFTVPSLQMLLRDQSSQYI